MRKLIKRLLIITVLGCIILGNTCGVNAKSKKIITKESKIALKKVASKLKKTKRCAYVDLTGDGIKDLLVNGKIWSYNYKTKKVKCKTFLDDDDGKLNYYSKLYISKKEGLIYFGIKENYYKDVEKYEDHEYYDPEDTEDDSKYECTSYGWIYSMRDANVNKVSRKKIRPKKYIAKMTYPRYFVSEEKYKSGEKYYIIGSDFYQYDDTFLAEDVYYNYYTSKRLKKTINKTFSKKVKLTKKPKL